MDKKMLDKIATSGTVMNFNRSHYTKILPDGLISTKMNNTGKLIFILVYTMYSEGHKFFMTNKKLAQIFSTSPRTISRVINDLERQNFICLFYKRNSTRIIYLTKHALHVFNHPKKSYKKTKQQSSNSVVQKLLNENKELKIELHKQQDTTKPVTKHKSTKSNRHHKPTKKRNTKRSKAKKAKEKTVRAEIAQFVNQYITNSTETQFNQSISRFKPIQQAISKAMKAIYDISNSKIKAVNLGLALGILENKNKLNTKKLDMARTVLMQRAELYKKNPSSRYSHAIKDARKSLNGYYYSTMKHLKKTSHFYNYKLNGANKNFHKQPQTKKLNKSDIQAKRNWSKLMNSVNLKAIK